MSVLRNSDVAAGIFGIFGWFDVSRARLASSIRIESGDKTTEDILPTNSGASQVSLPLNTTMSSAGRCTERKASAVRSSRRLNCAFAMSLPAVVALQLVGLEGLRVLSFPSADRECNGTCLKT